MFLKFGGILLCIYETNETANKKKKDGYVAHGA